MDKTLTTDKTPARDKTPTLDSSVDQLQAKQRVSVSQQNISDM